MKLLNIFYDKPHPHIVKVAAAIALTLLFCTLPVAFAEENLCAYLSGTWFGTYTFLHHHDCHENNGCTHLTSVEIKPLTFGGIQYQANMTIQMGQQVIVQFNCQNSMLTFPRHPESVSELSCANGACFIKYQDQKVSSTIIHVVTQHANTQY